MLSASFSSYESDSKIKAAETNKPPSSSKWRILMSTATLSSPAMNVRIVRVDVDVTDNWIAFHISDIFEWFWYHQTFFCDSYLYSLFCLQWNIACNISYINEIWKLLSGYLTNTSSTVFVVVWPCLILDSRPLYTQYVCFNDPISSGFITRYLDILSVDARRTQCSLNAD